MRLDPITPKGSGRDDDVNENRIRSVWPKRHNARATGDETITIEQATLESLLVSMMYINSYA